VRAESGDGEGTKSGGGTGVPGEDWRREERSEPRSSLGQYLAFKVSVYEYQQCGRMLISRYLIEGELSHLKTSRSRLLSVILFFLFEGCEGAAAVSVAPVPDMIDLVQMPPKAAGRSYSLATPAKPRDYSISIDERGELQNGCRE